MRYAIQAVMFAEILFLSIPVQAVTLEELAAQVEALANENQQLRQRVAQLEKDSDVDRINKSRNENAASSEPLVRLNRNFSYDILDPTTNINRKQQLLLASRQNGQLAPGSVILSGAITPIADYQKSNTNNKFGYLMRHPTANNQRSEEVSEAVIHSAQVAMTASLGDWTSSYVELLYDPQQSFGAGTTTDLNRNQVQVRRGFVTFGNLDRAPLHLSLGKMAVPFGLTDTLNPFTASTVWHSFGGLAYGARLGYTRDSLNINAMAIQGGAQFRAANVPVDGTSVPSKLNNFSVDINNTFATGNNTSLMLGASYLKGSAYCQGFPVVHFEPCAEENGAWDTYAQLNGSFWTLQAEYAETEEVWPGTFNPTIPMFAASKVSSWDIGGRIETRLNNMLVNWSADFSRFNAGPSSAPWESQDQLVLGVSAFPTPGIKLFGEIIRTEGYAPLNFISGGNQAEGTTHSDRNANSTILMFGTNVAF